VSDILDRIAGWCCPANMNTSDGFTQLITGPYFDEQGYQRGERINGVVQCPDCGLWWPLVEDVEVWVSGGDGKWHASEWGLGVANCLECECVIIDSFDGSYVLRN